MPETITRNNNQPRFLIPTMYHPDEWKETLVEKEIYTNIDYDKLPEGAPYQLIGGALIVTPAPDVNHQRISRNFGFLLHEYVLKHSLGEVFYAPIDVQLSNHDIFQPDIRVSNRGAEHRTTPQPDLHRQAECARLRRDVDKILCTGLHIQRTLDRLAYHHWLGIWRVREEHGERVATEFTGDPPIGLN